MQRIKYTVALCCFMLCSLLCNAQQVADTLYSPAISNPAYDPAQGPVVLIDEAHHNFHTLHGRYEPFANVLRKDGYVVKASTQDFTQAQLSAAKILVIANALHLTNTQQWTLPTPSAFTDAEIEAVNAWVKEGGSLFLIADHMPFPGAAEKLADSFGFKFYNGFAMGKSNKDIFTAGQGLVNNILTKGRNDQEVITSLQSFTGQAFEIPKEAQPVIVLDKRYTIKLPQTAWQFTKDTPTQTANGMAQGAFMNYGKGRIVVFGEAAMFSAQLQGKSKVGMNQDSAFQNFQFLLNTIHWLDGLLN